MSWVKRSVKREHRCDRPSASHRHGDLWRCWQCGTLWRVGDACDWCDQYGESAAHAGAHAVGVKWRSATFWQRLRYRRQGWEPDLPFEADVSGDPVTSQIPPPPDGPA